MFVFAQIFKRSVTLRCVYTTWVGINYRPLSRRSILVNLGSSKCDVGAASSGFTSSVVNGNIASTMSSSPISAYGTELPCLRRRTSGGIIIIPDMPKQRRLQHRQLAVATLCSLALSEYLSGRACQEGKGARTTTSSQFPMSHWATGRTSRW